MDALSSEELVRLCQRTLPDDTRAFEQLVMRYKGRVFATTYRLMGNQQEAEDQAQEVFIKVFRNLNWTFANFRPIAICGMIGHHTAIMCDGRM